MWSEILASREKVNATGTDKKSRHNIVTFYADFGENHFLWGHLENARNSIHFETIEAKVFCHLTQFTSILKRYRISLPKAPTSSSDIHSDIIRHHLFVNLGEAEFRWKKEMLIKRRFAMRRTIKSYPINWIIVFEDKNKSLERQCWKERKKIENFLL